MLKDVCLNLGDKIKIKFCKNDMTWNTNKGSNLKY